MPPCSYICSYNAIYRESCQPVSLYQPLYVPMTYSVSLVKYHWLNYVSNHIPDFVIAKSLKAMPKEARLDSPGTLHHVMIRGIEGREVFRDDYERQDFFDRVSKLREETGTISDKGDGNEIMHFLN